MFKSDISEVSVGYTDASTWCDYMKLKHKNPAVYKFVTNKLQLKDEEITSVTQFLIAMSNRFKVDVDKKKIQFMTDFVCNIYLNQFNLDLQKVCDK